MSLTIMEKRLCLDSKFLDQNLLSHLMAKLTEITFDECTEEYGYILSIKRIISIVNNEIGRANADNVFTVKFEVETLKPEAGKKLTGIVCMIYKDGIFIEIDGRQKLLISTASLKGYTFNEELSLFTNGKRSIKAGDIVSSVVIASQYNKNRFSCFGTLV